MFDIMAPMKQNQIRCHVSSSSPGGGTGAKLMSTIALLCHVMLCYVDFIVIIKANYMTIANQYYCVLTCVFHIDWHLCYVVVCTYS